MLDFVAESHEMYRIVLVGATSAVAVPNDDLALYTLAEGTEQLPQATLEPLLPHQNVGIVRGVYGNVWCEGFQDEIERIARDIGGSVGEGQSIVRGGAEDGAGRHAHGGGPADGRLRAGARR